MQLYMASLNGIMLYSPYIWDTIMWNCMHNVTTALEKQTHGITFDTTQNPYVNPGFFDCKMLVKSQHTFSLWSPDGFSRINILTNFYMPHH